jgi:hypothetical protein
METTTKIILKVSDFEYIGPIELSDYSYFELCKSDQYIAAGTVCNVGLIPDYLHPIDPDFSFDENLQAFIENLQYKSEDATYQHPDLITDFSYSFQ